MIVIARPVWSEILDLLLSWKRRTAITLFGSAFAGPKTA